MFFCVLNIFILSRLTIDLGDSGKIFLFLHYHSSIMMVIMTGFLYIYFYKCYFCKTLEEKNKNLTSRVAIRHSSETEKLPKK